MQDEHSTNSTAIESANMTCVAINIRGPYSDHSLMENDLPADTATKLAK